MGASADSAEQCDQMAKISFQYWAINFNENLVNIVKIHPVRFKIMPKTK